MSDWTAAELLHDHDPTRYPKPEVTMTHPSLTTTKLIMCKGLPASGKSTWTKLCVREHEDQAIRVNRDDLRQMLHAGHYSPANEKLVVAAERALIREYLHLGLTVIIDDTNLTLSAEAEWSLLAQACGVELEVRDFTHVSIDECILRDSLRDKPVGEDVIRRLAGQA